MGKGRAPCCDKSKVKSGAWSTDEDLRLVDFIQKNGHNNWRALPKQAGLMRCGKSCRLRWINYLRPDVKTGNFTPEEEQTIISLHNSIGNKWSKIASYFPGRTDNEVKNVWNTHLKKRVTGKTNNNKDLTSRKDEAGGFKMDHSGSPTYWTSSSITGSGSDPNMEKAQIGQDFRESSEFKKPDEVPEPNNSVSGKNQDSAFPELSIINDQENCTGDEEMEIPFDSNVEFGDEFDSLDPLQEPIGEVLGLTKDKSGRDVELRQWLAFLEVELGLTTDNDNLPDQKHLEMDLESQNEIELDFIQALNGSSGNASI